MKTTCTKWSTQDLQYLHDNCGQMTSLEMAEHLGMDLKRVQNKLSQLKLKAVRNKPVHTPRPTQKKVIDEALGLKTATAEFKKTLGVLENASTLKGAQAELLETMRALNVGKISARQAMAALEIGSYLIESAKDSMVFADVPNFTTKAPEVNVNLKKPHPWRELDRRSSKPKKLDEKAEPTGIFAGILNPKDGFIPPEIGRVTKVVDGVAR